MRVVSSPPSPPRLTLAEQATSRWIAQAGARHGVTLIVTALTLLACDLLGASVDPRVYIVFAIWYGVNHLDGKWAAAPSDYDTRLVRYAWTLAIDVTFLGGVYFFLNATQILSVGFFVLMVAAASAVLPPRPARAIGALVVVVFTVLLALDTYGPHVITSPLGLPPVTGNDSYFVSGVLVVIALTYLLLRTFDHVMAALDASESRHQAIIRTAGDMILITNDIGHIAEVNPAFLAATGYSWEELKATPNSALFPPEDWPQILDAFHRTLAGESVASDFRFVCKSGDVRWAEASTARIQIDGKPAAVVVARDVTERKAAAEQLREQDARLGLVLDALNSGFYTIDTNLTFTSVRGRGSGTGAGLVGRNVTVVARSPEDAVTQREQHKRALAGEVVTWVWPVGVGQWVRSHVAPIRNAAGEITGAAGFWRDESAVMRTRDEEDSRWSRVPGKSGDR
jgi:PAS domain S-box-containing protein